MALGFWVNVAYTYVTLAVGLMLMFLHAVDSPHLYGTRTAILMTGALIPWAGNLAFMLNREESTIDPTPFLFSCTALVAALAVFRYDLLDPVPTLREVRIGLVGDGVLILDARGRVADVNTAAEELLECRRAEAAGRPVRELLPEWPAGEVPDHPLELTVSGSRRPLTLDARWSPVRSPAGRVNGAVVILRDVTEERAREKLRERLLEEAQAANLRRDEFLAAVSHEMRTPLNAVVGWTHLLRRGQVDDSRMDHALSVIERNARAQARLVDDLLDWSGLAGGHTRLSVQRTNVLAVVQEAFDAVSPSAGARRITIDRDVPASVPDIRADPDRLRQVVWNLLANAIKFTPEGGHIVLTVRRAGDRDRDRRHRHGQGYLGRVSPARLRALPPGRHEEVGRVARARPRSHHRAPDRGSARGSRRGAQRGAWLRGYLLRVAPDAGWRRRSYHRPPTMSDCPGRMSRHRAISVR